MESAILLEELETLDSNILLEEVASAKEEAERPRSGLTAFTDGSLGWTLEAAGYSGPASVLLELRGPVLSQNPQLSC